MPQSKDDWNDLLDQAISNWLGKEWERYQPHNTRVYYDFGRFIGHPNDSHQGSYIVDIFNPDIQNKILLLTGPHWKTIIKILKVRQHDQSAA